MAMAWHPTPLPMQLYTVGSNGTIYIWTKVGAVHPSAAGIALLAATHVSIRVAPWLGLWAGWPAQPSSSWHTVMCAAA